MTGPTSVPPIDLALLAAAALAAGAWLVIAAAVLTVDAGAALDPAVSPDAARTVRRAVLAVTLGTLAFMAGAVGAAQLLAWPS